MRVEVDDGRIRGTTTVAGRVASRRSDWVRASIAMADGRFGDLLLCCRYRGMRFMVSKGQRQRRLRQIKISRAQPEADIRCYFACTTRGPARLLPRKKETAS